MRQSILLALAAALAATSAVAAQGTARTLSKPDAEYDEPFTVITSVRELRDGRVIIADAREKTVQIVDLAKGSAVAVGREGSGPGEYALPLRVLELPSDTSLVYDPFNQRFLIVHPNGKPGGFFSLNDGEREGPRFGMGGPRGVDQRGRLYFQTPSFSVGPEGPRALDSAAIVRLDRGTKKSDTIAFIKVPAANTQVSGGGGNVQVRVGLVNPFAAQDDWTVTPDGRIAIVRSSDYRMEYISPTGARVAGQPIKFDRVKVTEADKKAIRDQRSRGGPTMMIREGGGVAGGAQREIATGGRAITLPEPTDWPEYKPPFPLQGVVAAPNGQVWVLRHRPANDPIPTYDVFDARGQVVGKVALPKDTRLVGFGNGTVYLARNDADDLQYLQRYKL